MGRIVRRFARFYEMEMRGNYEAGTYAEPLAQYEVDQMLIGGVIAAGALGGDVRAGYFVATANADMTGNIYALHSIGRIADDITVTGSVFGAYIQSFLNDTSEYTITWEGIRVNMAADAASVLTGGIYGIQINNFIQAAPNGRYDFMRMSENGGQTVTAAFYISVGGAGDITNLFFLADTHTAWNPAGDITGGATAGFIQVHVGGVQKRIQLYTA